MTKPKNALVKQYCKLFGMDEIELVFTDAALESIAKKAIERNTGARGLRSVIEGIMMNIMYEVPSMKNVSRCIITQDSVVKKEKPQLIYKEEKPAS